MQGIHWRIPVAHIKNEIRIAKAKGQQHITFDALEIVVSNVEENLQLLFDIKLLEELNRTPDVIYKESYDKNIDKYAELVKTENELHRQYTQLVITAGYAGYFGLWAIISSQKQLYKLSAIWFDISLFFVTISIVSFVVLEITKIGLTGYDIHIKNQALLKAKAEDDINKMQGYVHSCDKYSTYLHLWVSNVWVITYPVSVVFGLAALLILLLSLVRNLSILH